MKFQAISNPGETEGLCFKLEKFAGMMAERIEANKAKGGWKQLQDNHILSQLRSHVSDLECVLTDIVSGKIEGPAAKALLLKTAVDVANYAMFAADNHDAV